MAPLALTMLAALYGAAAQAQQPAPPNLDAVPDKLPFATPYGAPIAAERAEALIQAAVAEARKREWAMNIAVLDSGGNLVAFHRMDGALLASISVSQQKARSAVLFRRPTKAFEDAVVKSGLDYLLSVDGVVAARGGIPLIENGRLIGAIGCSGGTGSQDEVVCTAAAAGINK